ncbi:TonB family protein [Chthonobacter rhizosphaerae]|uniref:TonB family protein n=1 Tax=Chthonobacter rhizosphaerae TaxID=2735553 RepID=UPI0015EF805B
MTAIGGRPADREGAGWGRWTAAFLVATALHGGGAALILPRTASEPAIQAPEAAVMIDLPPELALPPAETVESLASEGVDAETPTEVPTEAVEPPVETAAPVEAVAEPLPETVETAEVETTVAAEAVADAPAETPVEDAAEAAPSEVAEAAPADAVEAPPSEVAEAPPSEVVEAETVAPAPPVAPTPKPVRRVRPRPEAKVAETVRRVERAAPAPSRAAVAGERASGAGNPDPDALETYSATVRARIMRQRRTVDTRASRGARVTVRFTVAADGSVTGISVARSSGDQRLDEAAVAMVGRASPLPAIPAAVGRPSLTMSLPVRFDR